LWHIYFTQEPKFLNNTHEVTVLGLLVCVLLLNISVVVGKKPKTHRKECLQVLRDNDRSWRGL